MIEHGKFPGLDKFTGELEQRRKRRKKSKALDYLPSCDVALRFSKDGKREWVKAHNIMEYELGEGRAYDEVHEAATHGPDDVTKIAMMLYVFEHGLSHTPGTIYAASDIETAVIDGVGPEYVRRAYDIVSRHLYEAVSAYRPRKDAQERAEALIGNLETRVDPFTGRVSQIEKETAKITNAVCRAECRDESFMQTDEAQAMLLSIRRLGEELLKVTGGGRPMVEAYHRIWPHVTSYGEHVIRNQWDAIGEWRKA